MLRSLFSAISGLRSHQTRLDVVGNNVANVNTVGFKAGRAMFSDLISQTIKEAAAPQGAIGGNNPVQIGLGVQVAGIEQIFTQGTLLSTNNPNDRAIEGEGFFVLGGGAGEATYTRDGAMSFDNQGKLVNTLTQKPLQGWLADGAGKILNTATPTDIVIPSASQSFPATATTAIRVGGNLSSSDPVGTTRDTGLEVYDSLGNRHALTITYTKTGANAWSWAVASAAPGVTIANQGARTLAFDGNGLLSAVGNGSFDLQLTNGAAATQSIAPQFGAVGSTTSVTQYASAATIAPQGQDGYASGFLQSLVTDSTGVISGVYSNGLQRPLAQIAIATFGNPQGLMKAGESGFRRSSNSGDPLTGPPGNGRGLIRSGVLENSNVDLAQQFTDMIVAERGFQANSRLITTSDEVLQDLVNLKR